MSQDPIQQTATRIAGEPHSTLEHRLKTDMFNAILRVKPAAGEGVSFEDDVLTGTFFEKLPAPLQGIAVVKLENAISFYDRVGWRDAYLDKPVDTVLSAFQVEKLSAKLNPGSLHDLSYVSHKHVEKLLGKTESARLWENLKTFKLDS
ncbi:hypothetical protein AB833_17620 [Chromatiales bacterium (ex Bugula neritina AB1)]|nr:hypothetical protein AB833_17620 [Chromatiales bacterium (ex Bugula neritina AB1)]